MESESRTDYYVSKDGTHVSPASALDNVLKAKTYDKDLHLQFYDIFDGSVLNSKEKIDTMMERLADRNENKQYETTDHLIYSIEINGFMFLYASLDNSVRSNMNAYPLAHTRLQNLMEVVSSIVSQSDNECAVFFSESCRPSFYGHPNERTNEVTWLNIRNTISGLTSLDFLTEKRNNDDFSGLSFGVSVWTTPGANSFIDKYFAHNILDAGFGSGTVGVQLKTGEIVWGVHFPIDFKNTGSENNCYKAMTSLQQVMDTYTGSVCAFGDMNTISGEMNDAVRLAVRNNGKYELMLSGVNTFFGAFYDTVDSVARSDVTWIPVSDQPEELRYKMLEQYKVVGQC